MYKNTPDMQGKTASESTTIMTEIVLPNDTNSLGNLRGGRILHWMDIASAIAAGKHSNAVVVTASVDNVSFENPIKLGDVVTLTAKVTRVFHTSMETHIEVWAENLPSETRYKCNEAYYTFVALDSNGRPKKSVPLIPETEPAAIFHAPAKTVDGATQRLERRQKREKAQRLLRRTERQGQLAEAVADEHRKVD